VVQGDALVHGSVPVSGPRVASNDQPLGRALLAAAVPTPPGLPFPALPPDPVTPAEPPPPASPEAPPDPVVLRGL
jgi:hypothetical protein